MFIRELEPNSEVQITCVVNTEKASLPTTVIGPYKQENAVVIEALRHNGTLIKFDVGDISLEATTDKNTAVVFPISKIKPISVKGRAFHLIYSDVDAKPVNRRGAVRVPVGVKCTLKYGPKRLPVECYVKDLSYTGVSFTIKENREVNIGDEINAVFTYGDSRAVYKLFGTVVRANVDKKTGYLNVGAEFKSTSPNVQALVVAIQREEAQRRRGY